MNNFTILHTGGGAPVVSYVTTDSDNHAVRSAEYALDAVPTPRGFVGVALASPTGFRRLGGPLRRQADGLERKLSVIHLLRGHWPAEGAMKQATQGKAVARFERVWRRRTSPRPLAVAS